MNFKEMFLNGKLPENLEVMDAHGHLGVFPGTAGVSGGDEKLLEVMEKRGISKTAVSSTNAIIGDYIIGNNDMLEAVANSEGKILGYVTVNPNYDEGTVCEVKRCKADGVIGVKYHHSYSQIGVNDERLKPLFEYMNEKGSIVLLHVYSLSEVNEAEKIIVNYPNAKIIMGHSGTITGYPKVAELIKKYSNAYCDICMGSPRTNLLEHLVEFGDDNKILYGSDTPLTDPGTSFGRIMLADIPDSSKEKILGLNFKKLVETCSLY